MHDSCMSAWLGLDTLLNMVWAWLHHGPCPCNWAHLCLLLQVQATPPTTCPRARPAGHAPVETVAEMLERAAHDLGSIAGAQAPAIPPIPLQQQIPRASPPPTMGQTGPALPARPSEASLHMHQGPQAVHIRLSQQAQQAPHGVRPTPAPHSTSVPLRAAPHGTAVPLRPAPRSSQQQLAGTLPSGFPPSVQRERPGSASEPPLAVCAAGPHIAVAALEAPDSRKRPASEAALDQAERLAKRVGPPVVCSQSPWDPPYTVDPPSHIPPPHLRPTPLPRPAVPHAVLEALEGALEGALEAPDSTRQRRQSSQLVRLGAGTDWALAQVPYAGVLLWAGMR